MNKTPEIEPMSTRRTSERVDPVTVSGPRLNRESRDLFFKVRFPLVGSEMNSINEPPCGVASIQSVREYLADASP